MACPQTALVIPVSDEMGHCFSLSQKISISCHVEVELFILLCPHPSSHFSSYFPPYFPIPAGPNITDLTFTPDPVTEGENLMLECVAQNNLDAPNNLMFYWYHNESRISDEDSRRMITPLSEDNATRVASSMLVVTNVTRRDGGLYRCSVFNRNITDSDTATTSVTVYCKWSALLCVVT